MGEVGAGSVDLDAAFRRAVVGLEVAAVDAGIDAAFGLELFESQVASRHLDLAARRLGAARQGFYSIGSSGHEGNAAVAAALRVDDPALLHYRSGAFFVQRCKRVPGLDPIRDVLLGVVAAASDPISGGRHKVFGSAAASVIPQTSTIASHLPRAVGLAFALERAARQGVSCPWPRDAVVVCSFGDASANHSTATGAINAAVHASHQGVPMPIVFVCEDNGLGISVPTPPDWIERAYGPRPGLTYLAADGCDLPDVLGAAEDAVYLARTWRVPVFLHLRTVRLGGHAGSDMEAGYRGPAEMAADLTRDPLLGTARYLLATGVTDTSDLLARYDRIGEHVREISAEVVHEARLPSATAVTAPLAPVHPSAIRADVLRTTASAPTTSAFAATPSPTDADADALTSVEAESAEPIPRTPTALARPTVSAEPSPPDVDSAPLATGSGPAEFASSEAPPTAPMRNGVPPTEPVGKGSADSTPMTLAQAINHTLGELLARDPDVLVFGEDVGRKGGVYGVTKGLRKRFGARRVFDTLLDEQAVLGTALGTALAGFVPIPEIQYLAYVHNAADQIRGEAATLQFFSNGQYRNPLVVRIAGLAYQKGFGGHFHNDNSLAALRDVPGLVVAVPARADDAAALLRTCVSAARVDGRVCVFVEPIALYHTRDLYPGDEAWLASPNAEHVAIGSARVYGDGADLTIVTFGNGVPMSLRAADRLAAQAVHARVLDLRWLNPLPVEDLLDHARATGRVLVADETRRSGGVSESICTALVDAGYRGALARVTSADSFVPLGPAADTVLLGETDIDKAALALLH
ncbi:transketolase C-terminal domain-containing protein [Nocardia caishijiensis]|uniref:Pyruvate/2-oxoglutarate/acetoin dehydrogenase E1 component n=1 Tax=Nocardia caishijiensis TaxID=184756 RepID=A0ABQ6YNN1_9NOCA|nr:transketolase C-terminal domain-containing protein [Nocardia caishijiensis]KAF0847395.1 pyruvate/2-oxoglutarate/acetoin dehydrogenase E1 component [Nocardia caishijiensis]